MMDLELTHQIQTCTRCELSSQCKSPVPMQWPNLSSKSEERTLFGVVGEAPGRLEDRKGLPFIGPAGRYLRRELKAARLDPYNAYYMNAVSCWPRGTPTPEHLAACRQNLVDQWNAMGDEVKYVLVVGNMALEAVLPHATTHTKSILIPIHGRVIFPVYHPSYILFHNPSAAPSWKEDLRNFYLAVEGWLYVGSKGMRCVYCRKPVAEHLYWTCNDHAAWWRKDQRWKVPPPPQMSLEL